MLNGVCAARRSSLNPPSSTNTWRSYAASTAMVRITTPKLSECRRQCPRGVSTAGLDLTTSAGAAGLESRVKDAAAAACKEIGNKHPNASPSDAECARKATEEAMVKVHQLVAAAQKAKK